MTATLQTLATLPLSLPTQAQVIAALLSNIPLEYAPIQAEPQSVAPTLATLES